MKNFTLLCALFILSCPVIANAIPTTTSFSVTVTDSIHKVPLPLARVELRRGKKLIAGRVTNTVGKADFRDIEEGWYSLTVRYVSYGVFHDSLLIDASHTSMNVALIEEEHQDIVVSTSTMPSISSVNPLTSNQTFESETYHASPAARMTNLIQENVAGAARATTGEVHIRGQHGEFTYYVDGIPIPLGVFGGLNEVVDPKVTNRATFLTGGFPAEYGGQMAGIVDIQNRVPSGHFHLDAEIYGGSYLLSNKALNSNGSSLSLSDHLGSFGYFISGSRQETDRRIDPPVPYLSHDHGFDYFLYGKFDYLIGNDDYVTMNLNWGRTYTEIPFDSVSEGILDDRQKTTNAFQTLSYFHTISSEHEHESNLFIGAYAREGGLIFTPGANDPHNFRLQIGNLDTLESFILAEDRSFTTIGLRTKFDQRLSHELMYSIGFSLSSTSGTENFTTYDIKNQPGPVSLSNYKGSDFGVFLQTEYHPLEWTRFDLGIRYDQHIAPDAALQKQFSPRIRWNFLIDESTTAYLYYGKLFMPTNIEGLRQIASNVASSSGGTLPERDDFYEAAFTHGFDFGITAKFAYFHKFASPGTDDQTIGSSAIKTPVNIETVKTDGIELALSYRHPTIPLSGLMNAAITHTYGAGKITGGFLDINTAGAASDLDHDQRLSIVFSANYQPQDWFVNASANYGSGATNGNPDNITFGTGLFDFNTGAHVTPAWIMNISGGYTIHLSGSTSIEPSLYITNLFDNAHLLKGVFFSGASWEERRNVILKLSLHI